jgi:hypothetical protein
VPPDETTSMPPFDTVVPIAVPALPTTCDPEKIVAPLARPVDLGAAGDEGTEVGATWPSAASRAAKTNAGGRPFACEFRSFADGASLTTAENRMSPSHSP